MTWAEFKQAVEAGGPKDGDEIWYIDLHPIGPESIECTRDLEMGWKITGKYC